MSILQRLLEKLGSQPARPQRLDYLNEALALERQGDYSAAITSSAIMPHPPCSDSS